MEDVFVGYETDLLSVESALARDSLSVHPMVRMAVRQSETLTIGAIRHLLGGAIRREAMPGAATIPHLSHRVWITSEDLPMYPSEYFLRKSAETIRILGEDWCHVYWVRSSDHAAHFLDWLRKSRLPRTEVRTLDTLPSWSKAEARVERLVHLRLYVADADVARLVILADLGGLYCDIGIRLNVDISPLLASCNYAFQWGQGLFLQNSMMAAPADDALFRLMCVVASQPSRFHGALFEPLTAETEMWAAGGPGISLLLYLMGTKTLSLRIFTSNGHLVNHEAQQSWYRPATATGEGGAHGNALAFSLSPVTPTWSFGESPMLLNLAEA